MAKVLIFNNTQRRDINPLITQSASKSHNYNIVNPGKLYANPYHCKKKHMGLFEFIKRILLCMVLFWESRNYDVLILDTTITGILMSLLLFFKRKPKIVISHFNVLRRRGFLGKWIGRLLFKRIDHCFVHSGTDIEIAVDLYCLPKEHLSFRPFVRLTAPAHGEPNNVYLSGDQKPFILSYGVNARDYKTFFRAIEGTDLSAIVVARDYNLAGLDIPDNVRTFCNIPLAECDRLVGKCLFTVFTFDGSEPSCGQISIVTSFMLGKPTICTDIAGVRDYVSDGENGLLVKLGDVDDLRNKILKLTHDKELYNHLSAGARAWARQYSDPRALQKTVDDLVTRLVSCDSPR